MTADAPTPTITARADGHYATCPRCGQETEVVVTDMPFLDETGAEKGHTSAYDLAAYVSHHQAEHPDA